MRIAMVSEHASPLAALGGVDAGGQNVYVARLSEELARRGHDVTVYTRRDAVGLPDRVPLPGGAVVEHVPAGPAQAVPKDELLPYMPAFGAWLEHAWARERPDVVHAHFWMSGMASRIGAHPHGVPVVQTFHALGTVKRRHQGRLDTSPPERVGIERQIGRGCARVLATCTDEVQELAELGVPPRHVSVVPCGVDAGQFRPGVPPEGVPARRKRHRLLACGRLVPRKGYDQAIQALAGIPDAELLIAGGPEAGLLADDPEARRLRRLARRIGVGGPGRRRRHHGPARPAAGSRIGRRRGARTPHRRRTAPPSRHGRTGTRPHPLHLAARRRRRGASPPPGPRRTRTAEGGGVMTVHPPVTGHCDELQDALTAFRASAHITQRWGERLAAVLTGGGRLLAAGNGGSAAQAQHLTAELVGRYRDDRPPFSALALHADTSSTTAIANDYGVDEVFARQVRAHGRPGDILMLLSTSGASANLLSAAYAARAAGVRVWALTGCAPNPLMAGSDEYLCVEAPTAATVQELHLVAVHMVCAAFDAAVERGSRRDGERGR